MNLLAKPYSRKDGLLLGNYAINVTNITIPQAKALTKFIQAVTPLTLYLPITLESLETKRLAPKKNYDTNVLEPGLFQMLDSTFVICDESFMKEGQVKENGINSIKAIATLIEQQTVSYDFQYYQQEMPINAGVIVLSDGRSMFKNTTQVPVSKNEEKAFDETKLNQILNDQDLLNQLRRYFLILQHYSEISLQDYHIPNDVSEYCQNIFIEQRKKEQETTGEVKTNADTFHNWLSLARLDSIADGELVLSTLTFEKVKNMEAQRLARLGK